MRQFVTILIWLCVAPLMIAQEPKIKIPAEVAPFVEKGTAAIALEKGDLNGDGREDMDRQPVGLREIDGRELDTRLYQAGHEMNVAREPVQLRDNERCTKRTA